MHQGKITDGKAAIDRCIMDDDKAPWTFDEPFVAKTIHGSKTDAQDKWINEVNAMKGLRHPHIVALLGTCEHLGQLSILMYPVAWCDLQKFMAVVDTELQRLRNQSPMEGRGLGESKPSNTSSSMEELTKLNVSMKNRTSPLELPWLQQL